MTDQTGFQLPPGRLDRRTAMQRLGMVSLGLVGLTSLSGCAGEMKAAEGDMALGAPEGAKVTVIEYASITCGHCARWHAQVWPDFKARYVDTAKVRYIFREFPTAPVEVATAGFMLARCAGEDRYFEVINLLMTRQAELLSAPQPRTVLLDVAASAGLDEARFQTCLGDTAAVARIDERVRAGLAAGVDGTPSFFVNSEKITDTSLDGLSARIETLLAGG
jgi:protein-disulfide isomerase